MKSSAIHFQPGDVLYGRLRPYLNKVVCPDFEGLCSPEFLVFPTQEHLDSKYLMYFLNAPELVTFAAHLVTGDRPRVDFQQLSGHVFPLVGIDEQRRIVEEIEKQLTRLEAGVAALKRVQRNLKRHRATVLKAACEGRLVPTEAELARREGRSYEPASALLAVTPAPPRPNRWSTRSHDVIPGHAALGVGKPDLPLPEGWAWSALADVARMESGHTPSREHPEWWDGDIPWIGLVDARENHGRVIRTTHQHTNNDGLANSAARLLPMGTVCVSRTASVGYVVVMGQPMATSQDFVNWVPSSAVLSDWLRIVFLADRGALRGFGKGSVHTTIYYPEWLSVCVAIPPLAEQHRVVTEVDRRLSLADNLDHVVAANLHRATRLRQSILAAAFSDRLTGGHERRVAASLPADDFRPDSAKPKNPRTNARSRR